MLKLIGFFALLSASYSTDVAVSHETHLTQGSHYTHVPQYPHVLQTQQNPQYPQVVQSPLHPIIVQYPHPQEYPHDPHAKSYPEHATLGYILGVLVPIQTQAPPLQYVEQQHQRITKDELKVVKEFSKSPEYYAGYEKNNETPVVPPAQVAAGVPSYPYYPPTRNYAVPSPQVATPVVSAPNGYFVPHYAQSSQGIAFQNSYGVMSQTSQVDSNGPVQFVSRFGDTGDNKNSSNTIATTTTTKLPLKVIQDSRSAIHYEED